MNGMFIVFSTVILVLWVIIIFVSITPWLGMSIIPYLVLATFLGSAIIIGIVAAFNAEMFENVGWETFTILALILASLLIGIFVLWYFIRKKTHKYLKHVKHQLEEQMPCEAKREEIKDKLKHFMKEKLAMFKTEHHHEEKPFNVVRDPETNTPTIVPPSSLREKEKEEFTFETKFPSLDTYKTEKKYKSVLESLY